MLRILCALMMVLVFGSEAYAQSFQLPLDSYPTGDGCLDWGGSNSSFPGKYHVADDACVSSGTNVLAVADGTVKFAASYGSCPNWGYLIVVEHTMNDGSKVNSIYGHVSPISGITAGKEVTKGQHIGEVESMSCWSDHIHFGIYDGPFSEIQCNGVGDCLTAGYLSTDDWPGNYVDPVSFVGDHEGTCDTDDEVTWDMSLVVTDPDSSSSDQYDFHTWYRMNVGSGSDDYDETNGHLYLLDRSDLGSEYADPVINNEGYKSNHEQWLIGNLNDDEWDDIILIAHNSGDMKAQVWLSNGDGTFESKSKWLETNTQYDIYLHGDRGKLIAGIWDDGLQWYNCNANDDNDGYKSCSHWGELGGDVDDDVYLTGDFNGDGKADVLRGYVASGADTCAIDNSQKNLKWRVLEGGESSPGTWLTDWGCEKSKYVVGDFNGDGKDDIVQLRFDDSSTGRMIVALSECKDGTSTCSPDDEHEFVGYGTWKNDFGDKNYQYFVHDMNGDGYDDVIHYKDNSKDHIHTVYSTGTFFGYYDYHKGGVDMESGGAFLFGDFGELVLDEDELEICE